MATPSRRSFHPWKYVLLVIAALALAGYATAGCFAAPRYKGPVSDHFDGREFHNVDPFEQRGFWDLLRWQFSGQSASWPDWADIAPVLPPPPRVNAGVQVTFVNHATWLIQMDGVNLLTDPIWSNRAGPLSWLGARRHKPPGVRFEDLPPIDAVVISHNHYDHLDLPTIERLVLRDHPLIVVGLGTRQLLQNRGIDVGRVVEMDWWQSRAINKLRVTFAPAQHWSTRGPGDRNGTLWGSFYIASAAQSVYFAGDTGAGSHFDLVRKKLGAPTIALLPIGAYQPRWFMRPQHIDPEAAVAAHRALGAKRSLAMHWGTFDQADEGMNDPPKDLQRALINANIPADEFITVDNGGRVVFPSL